MIDAHMDELGGMVRRVGSNGQLTMKRLGGWLDQALVDQRWVILGSKGPVEAVTGIRDIHVASPTERNEVIPRNSIFLDIGAKTPAEAAAMGVEPGDAVVPTTGLAARCWWRRCSGWRSCRTPTSCSLWRPRRRRLGCVGRERRRVR